MASRRPARAVLGVIRPFNQRFHAETDRGKSEKGLSEKDESAGISEFANKHQLVYRLGFVDNEDADNGDTVPHA